MFVSGNISARSFQDVTSSQKISTLGAREVSGYGTSIPDKKIQKAKIKFKKLKGSDKILAPFGLSDDYYYEEQEGVLDNIKRYLNIVKDTEKKGNFFLSGVADDDVGSVPKYFNSTYLLTNIESPEPYKGEGTEALQGLVEKSLIDEDTQGRVILYLSQIAPEDSSWKFFYKLGFRSVDENINLLIQDAIDKNMNKIIIPEAYMYLPQGNIQKLLRYGQLF